MENKSIIYRIKEKLRSVFGRRIVAVLLTVAVVFSMVGAVYTAGGIIELPQQGNPLSMSRSLSPLRRTAYVSNNQLIRLSAVSTELDLDILVLDMNGAQVTGIPFEVIVTNALNNTEVARAVDEDMDGNVYLNELEEGSYIISVAPVENFETPNPIYVDVAPKIVYEKQDVSDLIVTESEIDVSTDDKQYGEVTGGGADSGNSGSVDVTTDTVEYVESRVESTTEEVVKPVVDSNGVQVVKFKPSVLADGKYLVDSAGNATKYYVELDAEGYITAIRYENAVGGEEEPITEDPSTGEGSNSGEGNNTGTTVPETPPQPPTEEIPEHSYVDAWSEVIGSDGTILIDVQVQKIELTTTETVTTTTYYGWQENNTYYYDKNGKPVTGVQVIQGVTYVFGADGKRGDSGGANSIGIDVSTWQDYIDWQKVKASGIDYAFIRLGFRGYGSGKLVVDSMYHANMRAATAAGIKVGVYFFSQATNEQEAIEEASMCLQLVQGYAIQLPIAIDVEYAAPDLSGRADGLSRDMRTKVCVAFCETVRNAGYVPAVYANKDFFVNKLYASSLSSYIIWLAHYTGSINTPSSYSGRYDIWQYSSRGSVDGIKGNVDMNISYLNW